MPMRSRMLRIGLIGAGRMGSRHAELLRQEPNVQVVAACDLVLERAQAVATTWDGQAYTRYTEMLEREELDAVYVCTPTYNHAEIALACVERGLPLFLEKPVDLDLKAAGRLLQAVEERNLLASVALHWRYTRGYEAAAWAMEGRPVSLVNLRWYWTRPPAGWMWDRQRAGGQIVDQNTHLIDLAQALVGDITHVHAFYNEKLTNLDQGFDNWDSYAVSFRFRNGAVGLCAGTYSLFPEIQAGPTADFALRDELLRVTDRGAARFTADGVDEWSNEGPFRLGVNRAFIRALRTGDHGLIRSTLRAGFRSTAVALAANHAAQTGETVEVDAFIAQQTDLPQHFLAQP